MLLRGFLAGFQYGASVFLGVWLILSSLNNSAFAFEKTKQGSSHLALLSNNNLFSPFVSPSGFSNHKLVLKHLENFISFYCLKSQGVGGV